MHTATDMDRTADGVFLLSLSILQGFTIPFSTYKHIAVQQHVLGILHALVIIVMAFVYAKYSYAINAIPFELLTKTTFLVMVFGTANQYFGINLNLTNQDGSQAEFYLCVMMLIALACEVIFAITLLIISIRLSKYVPKSEHVEIRAPEQTRNHEE
jgi:hypothetical protein